MKKVLIVLALAVVLALAMAVPAFAAGGAMPDYPDAVYVGVDGGWWTLTDNALGPYHPPATDAVPAGSHVYIVIGWVGYSRGLVQTAPLFLHNTLTVDGQAVVGGKWWPAYEMTPELLETMFPPFNANLGAKAWEVDWLWDMGTPAVGVHTSTFSQVQTRVAQDLTGGWFEGQHAPLKIPPTTYVFEGTFTVQ